MEKQLATYIYAYTKSSIKTFCLPLQSYLSTRDMTLGDIHYYTTLYNKDKSIKTTQFKELLNSIKNYQELILMINIYPPKNEIELITKSCKKYNCKLTTISKQGELLEGNRK